MRPGRRGRGDSRVRRNRTRARRGLGSGPGQGALRWWQLLRELGSAAPRRTGPRRSTSRSSRGGSSRTPSRSYAWNSAARVSASIASTSPTPPSGSGSTRVCAPPARIFSSWTRASSSRRSSTARPASWCSASASDCCACWARPGAARDRRDPHARSAERRRSSTTRSARRWRTRSTSPAPDGLGVLGRPSRAGPRGGGWCGHPGTRHLDAVFSGLRAGALRGVDLLAHADQAMTSGDKHGVDGIAQDLREHLDAGGHGPGANRPLPGGRIRRPPQETRTPRN